MALIIRHRLGKSTQQPYAELLNSSEVCILTTSQNGIPSQQELTGTRYIILFENDKFSGFYNPTTQILHRNPTNFCKELLPPRNGQTNEWRGPQHVLVLRENRWTNLNSL
jgi:hypothetical protein